MCFWAHFFPEINFFCKNVSMCPILVKSSWPTIYDLVKVKDAPIISLSSFFCINYRLPLKKCRFLSWKREIPPFPRLNLGGAFLENLPNFSFTNYSKKLYLQGQDHFWYESFTTPAIYFAKRDLIIFFQNKIEYIDVQNMQGLL